MGAFFTNVQVRAGSRDLGPLLDALRQASRMDELDPSSPEEPDRTILVFPPDAGGWVAIYDSLGDWSDMHERLGALASRALDVPAFSVLVHDSDVLRLALFERGACVDRYDSWSYDFWEEGKPSPGDPTKWAALIVGPHGEADLREAWHSETLFVEQSLARVAQILGCDAWRVEQGFRYVERLELPAGTITLRLRARERPAWERPATGAPCFETESPYDTKRVDYALGDQLYLGLRLRSTGGPSKGLSVVCWGDAIDRGLVTVERVHVWVGENQLDRTHHPVRSEGEGALLSADLPDEEIPAGLAGTFQEALWSCPDFHTVDRAFRRTTVRVAIVGQVVAPGDGELACSVVPHANPHEGSDGARYALHIDPPFERPLRALTAEQCGGKISHLLRPLAGDRVLDMLAVLDAPPREGAELARATIAAAIEVLGAEGTVVRTILPHDARTRSMSDEADVRSALAGSRLDEVVRAMERERFVDLVVRDGPAFEESSSDRWGVSFGIPLVGAQEDALPVLRAWFDADAVGDEPTAHLRARWSAILDAAMGPALVQGALLRRGGDDNGAGATAYETATGTFSSRTTTRAWVTRWLRVPGNDRTWLGPSLASRLEASARAALAKIADVTEREGGLAITLRRRADFAELERALEVLLASHEDVIKPGT